MSLMSYCTVFMLNSIPYEANVQIVKNSSQPADIRQQRHLHGSESLGIVIPGQRDN